MSKKEENIKPKEAKIGKWENCVYNHTNKFDQIDLINGNLEVALITGNAEMIGICMKARRELGLNNK